MKSVASPVPSLPPYLGRLARRNSPLLSRYFPLSLPLSLALLLTAVVLSQPTIADASSKTTPLPDCSCLVGPPPPDAAPPCLPQCCSACDAAPVPLGCLSARAEAACLPPVEASPDWDYEMPSASPQPSDPMFYTPEPSMESSQNPTALPTAMTTPAPSAMSPMQPPSPEPSPAPSLAPSSAPSPPPPSPSSSPSPELQLPIPGGTVPAPRTTATVIVSDPTTTPATTAKTYTTTPPTTKAETAVKHGRDGSVRPNSPDACQCILAGSQCSAELAASSGACEPGIPGLEQSIVCKRTCCIMCWANSEAPPCDVQPFTTLCPSVRQLIMKYPHLITSYPGRW